MNLKDPIYQGVIKNPTDTDQRLVYADFLFERNDPLAQFILAQRELASFETSKESRRVAYQIAWDFQSNQVLEYLNQETTTRPSPSLASWEWDLPYQMIPGSWREARTMRPGFANYLIPETFWMLQNGLPDTLSVPATTLIRNADALFSHAPIVNLAVTHVATPEVLEGYHELDRASDSWTNASQWGRLEDVLELKQLTQIQSLSIMYCHLRLEDVRQLVRCNQLSNLESLRLYVVSDNFDKVVHEICNSEILGNLKSLTLEYSAYAGGSPRQDSINDRILKLIARPNSLSSLEQLSLCGGSYGGDEDRITSKGIQALLDSGRFTSIDLAADSIDDSCLDLIAKHPNSTKLTSLRFGNERFTSAGLKILFESRELRNLEELKISYPAGDQVNFSTLVQARHFEKLTLLVMRNSPLSTQVVDAIPVVFPALRNLKLSGSFDAETATQSLTTLFEHLEFLNVEIYHEDMGERLANAGIFDHLIAFRPGLAMNSAPILKLIDTHTASRLQYFSNDFSTTWEAVHAQRFVESPLGQSLLVLVNDSLRDTSSKDVREILRGRWGSQFAAVWDEGKRFRPHI